MKTLAHLVILFTLVAGTGTVHGQAAVNFVNRLPARFITPVYMPNPIDPQTRISGHANTNGGAIDYTGHALVVGTGFIASLWAAPVQPGVLPPAFEQIATSRFRTLVPLAGTWSPVTDPSTVIIPFIIEPETPAQFQVRVWDSQNNTLTSWAAALADSTSVLGFSDIFVLTPRFLPSAPGSLDGLTSFNLTIVPEPTALTLGLLGTILAATGRVRRR